MFEDWTVAEVGGGEEERRDGDGDGEGGGGSQVLLSMLMYPSGHSHV